MKKYFITAIGTDSGKSIVSAICTQALNADYWKPVQAGTPTDTTAVRQLITNPSTRFHPELYLLSHPMSPHAAAAREGININLGEFTLPSTDGKPLIVEGAGGLLVPLNQEATMLDLIQHLDIPVILVSNHYLGSINHTLLTVAQLKQANIPVKGIVFNGSPNPETEEVILHKTGIPCILHLNHHEMITPQIIEQYANDIKEHL